MIQQVERVYNRSKDLLFLPAFDRYWRKQLYGHVICLLYHRVDDPSNNTFLSSGGSPVISPTELERELRFLKKQGAVFLTFADLREGVFPNRSEFGVVISFDDCFLDNYTHGLEVLENLGIKAVFFQTSGMVEAKELIWEHSLYWLTRNEPTSRSFTTLAHRVLANVAGIEKLYSNELVSFLREGIATPLVEHLLSCAKQDYQLAQQMTEVAGQVYAKATHVVLAHQMGHEIGSHGHMHLKRKNIDAEAFEHELSLSRETLRQIIGSEPQAFSYPFNSYEENDELLCSRYFLQAATVDKRLIKRDTSPMWIPRFTWPGTARSSVRQRRWLLTGSI